MPRASKLRNKRDRNGDRNDDRNGDSATIDDSREKSSRKKRIVKEPEPEPESEKDKIKENKKNTKTNVKKSENNNVQAEVDKGKNKLKDNVFISNHSIISTGDFRIITGSYERILYGIDARWIKEDNDQADKDEVKLQLEPLFIFSAHIGYIKTVAASGRYLASGSTDEIIRLYDLKRLREHGSLHHHNGSITTLCFYSTTHMLSGSEDGLVAIWRTKGWECLKSMKGHKACVNSIAVHPSGKMALSVGKDGAAIVWDLVNGRKGAVWKIRKEGEVVLWNTSGEFYAILSRNEITIYNVADAQVSQTITQKSMFLCMRYYKDDNIGEVIITGSEDKIIRAFDVNTGKCIVEFSGHKNRIKSLDIIRSNRPFLSIPITLLVSISSDGIVNVWNLSSALEKIKPDKVAQINKVIASHDTANRLICVVCAEGGKSKLGEGSVQRDGGEESKDIDKDNKEDDTDDESD